MTLSHQRRVARISVAAGLVAALSAAGPIPMAFSADSPSATTSADPSVKSAAAKLGSDDADLLATAKADGDKNVTMMIATAPGATEQVAQQLDAVKGGSVGRTYDKLGYVRATVPTGRADSAIAAAAKLSSVQAIDLRQEIALDDPTPSADTAKGADKATGKATYSAPNKNTPAENPYNPSFETGAVDFVKKNPKADGRGITIGILDSGVDLGHPALQKTTTGERKIVDWVTSTDPIADGDQTWRPMVTAVSGPDFTYGGTSWTAPAGSYEISTFKESYTTGGDAKGDANRDGDTTDSWGVLYDPAAGTVTVDLNNNHDFGDDTPMKPYKDGYQIGYFGTDNPATDVVERQPFVVQISKDVPMDPYGGSWVGKTADFVNIGVIESEHGTHVAGITAANGLFGGRMNGEAPGAKIVSSRACTWTGGCTNVALTEGMIDLVANRGVDIVNMSIGGLPALNDGNNARAALYTRLIDTYGVQLVISAGNSGPGANTIGDPGLADKVISVGASISKQTWAANYGSQVATSYQLLPFSSRGPREDGGFTPTLVAPGAAINTTQTWLPGSPVPEAGYTLPAGYSMLQGTSMASPRGGGRLGAAAERREAEAPRPHPGDPAHGADLDRRSHQGCSGLRGGRGPHQHRGRVEVHQGRRRRSRVHGEGSRRHGDRLRAEDPGLRHGPLRPRGRPQGRREEDVRHHHHANHRCGQGRSARAALREQRRRHLPDRRLGRGQAPAEPAGHGQGAGGAQEFGHQERDPGVDDPRTEGLDKQILTTVVVASPVNYTYSTASSVQRNSTQSYFVSVPAGAKALEVAISGLKDKSQTRFISIHPYGVPVEDTGTPYCYNNYLDGNGCKPDVRSYADPQAGVWEIEVEARRTSPLLDNPYKLDATVLGAAFDPETVTVPEAKVGTPATASWKVTNNYAALTGTLKGGPLGSSLTARPTITEGVTQTTTVDVPTGATSLNVAIGNVSDAAADLDLTVKNAAGTVVGTSADGDSEEAVSMANPVAGTYTVEVAGYSVPSGSTAYDYRDVFFSPALGTVGVDASAPVKLATGASATVSGSVTALAPAPAGREFFGQVQLVDARGTVAGVGSVKIEKVTS